MRIAQISCKHRDTPVWAIQVLLWWPEDLASLSTAAHATLNTPHSPWAFLPSDIRVKQTRQTSELKYWSSFEAIPWMFLYLAMTQCDTNTTHQRFPFVVFLPSPRRPFCLAADCTHGIKVWKCLWFLLVTRKNFKIRNFKSVWVFVSWKYTQSDR